MFLIDPYRGDEVTAWWVNPGAETQDTTGWVITQGNFQVAGPSDSPPRYAPEGLYCFEGGPDSLVTRAYQRVELAAAGVNLGDVDAGLMEVLLDWWGGAFIQLVPDQPQVRFFFRDVSLAEISLATNGLRSPSTTIGGYRWNQYHEEFGIPSGTRYVDIELYGQRNTGTFNDALFDDIGPPIFQLV